MMMRGGAGVLWEPLYDVSSTTLHLALTSRPCGQGELSSRKDTARIYFGALVESEAGAEAEAGVELGAGAAVAEVCG